MTKQEVIKRLLPKATELNKLHGFHISMTIGQIVRESGWLKHAPGNNFLGIKAPLDKNKVPTVPANRVQWLLTTEWENGKWVKKKCAFMNYASLEDCMDRYAKILLLKRYKQTREAKDWYDATNYVRLNGYATSPVYTDSLRDDILLNKLYMLDWKHDGNKQLTENFIWEETFSNVLHRGKKYIRVIEPYKEYWSNVADEAEFLQTIRTAANCPMVINRWWNITSYNAYVGGTPGSQHLFGLAADCARPRKWTMQQYFDYVNKTKATGIGVGKRYLHIDIRKDTKRIWYY